MCVIAKTICVNNLEKIKVDQMTRHLYFILIENNHLTYLEAFHSHFQLLSFQSVKEFGLSLDFCIIRSDWCK